MEKWTRSWAIREYAVTEEFERQMAEAGFPDVVVRDVTRSVDRSVRRLFFYYYPGLVYPATSSSTPRRARSTSSTSASGSRVELQAQHLGKPARLEGTLAYI